jgi:hypothetical protein
MRFVVSIVTAQDSCGKYKMTSSRMHGQLCLCLSLTFFADTFFGTLEACTRVPRRDNREFTRLAIMS